MQPKKRTWPLLVLMLVGAWVALGTPGFDSFSLPSINSKTTQATYVYSAQHHTIPGPVSAGLQKLNSMGIVATTFEVDNKNGHEKVPAQYEIAAGAAKELPALVVQAGVKVTRTLKVTDKTTETDVVEAAQ